MSAEAWNTVALPYRVEALEKNEEKTATRVGELEGRQDAAEKTQATQAVELSNLSGTVGDLKDAVKWTNRILIGLCVSITGSAIGVMLTIGGHL